MSKIDISLVLCEICPQAEYFGSLTSNTREAFDALDWRDKRTKPTWEEVENGWASLKPKLPASIREGVYRIEIDAIRDKILSYQVEAEAWWSAGNPDKAKVVEDLVVELQAEYLSKKQEIRDRYPDSPEEPIEP